METKLFNYLAKTPRKGLLLSRQIMSTQLASVLSGKDSPKWSVWVAGNAERHEGQGI